LNIVNLGVVWSGRDLDLLLVKKLLQRKHPQLLIIEISEYESAYGHPLVPYVGNVADIFCCRFFLDMHFPKSLLTFLHRQVVNMASIVGRSMSNDEPNPKNGPGWTPLYGERAANSIENRVEREFTWHDKFNNYAHKLASVYGLCVLRSIVALARKKGVHIAFLYLPEYRYAGADPLVDIQNYLDMAPVVFLPKEILTNRNYWYDPGHLNAMGARALVPAVATEIRALLTPGHFYQGPVRPR
jgi:hypothetical protein